MAWCASFKNAILSVYVLLFLWFDAASSDIGAIIRVDLVISVKRAFNEKDNYSRRFMRGSPLVRCAFWKKASLFPCVSRGFCVLGCGRDAFFARL